MEVLESPMFFMSVLIGAGFLALSSFAWQKYSDETEGQVKPKAVLRDGILGAIFTAMAWMFLPDSMKSLTESIASSMSSTTTAVASTTHAISSDYDIQIGPARF
jgi:hypothetical protein